MANGLTNLIPDAYTALDQVSRELVGLIPSVRRDPTVERAAVGQIVRSFATRAAAATDITPGVTPPDDGDQTIDNIPITITKARRVPFRWQGEESRGINNGGPGVLTIQQDQIAQALRTLVNEIETDLAAEHVNFSRAYGTAGTTPFVSDLSDTALVRKIMDDNGAPLSDRQLVINTTAGAKMRTLTQLTKANEANDATMLRQGTLLDVHGYAIRESAQIATSVAGTAASATTNAAGYAIGATIITLAAAGTGTFVAGDIVQFAGDANKYVLASGDTDVSNGGTITLNAPGLRVAMSAATKAITVVAAAARNMAFNRSAIVLAQRLPALPEGGDLARDRTTIQDPRSGLVFEIAMYPQYRQMQYEVSCVWGKKTVKAAHTALLLG